MKVKVRNGNVNTALRVFKRANSDKLFDLRSKQYHEKKSDKKRVAKKAAIAREKRRIKDDRNKL